MIFVDWIEEFFEFSLLKVVYLFGCCNLEIIIIMILVGVILLMLIGFVFR